MDAQKLVSIQHQIRQNQEEFNSYVSDLTSWADDMKNNEDKVKAKNLDTNDTEMPPVRNSLMKKRKKKKIKAMDDQETNDKKTKKKISAYDYRAWDKFDADAAAEEIDTEKPNEEDDDDYETDEEWEEERRQLLAKEEKDKGNNYFKASNWDMAVECYTTAIRLDPTNPVLYTNRAMAQIRANRLAAAESDCTTALKIDSNNVKALFRRGIARKGIGKGHESEALEDFEKVLKLEPNNKAAKSEFETLEKIVRPTGEVKAISKDASQRSKKPLRRIEIEEIGFGESVSLAKKPEPDLEKFLKKREENSTSEDDKVTATVSASSTTTATVPTSSLNPAPVEIEILKPSSPETVQPLKKEYPVPQNFNQFQSVFSSLKYRNDGNLNNYLLSIPPQDYQRIFGQCLEPRHINAIVLALSGSGDAEASQRLAALRRVPRFSFLAMMVGQKEREAVKELREKLRVSSLITQTDFEQIGKDFRL